MIIALYGWYVEPDARMMILIFALLSLAFGALVILHPTWLTRFKLLKNCEVNGCGSCDTVPGEPSGKPSWEHSTRFSETPTSPHSPKSSHAPLSTISAHSCDTCSHSDSCPSQEGSSTTKALGSGTSLHGIDRESHGFHFSSIFLLGSIRGATPCVKIMMLVPLILTLSFQDAMALVVIYALSSSIYTVAGILVGSSIGSAAFSEWRPHLTRAGATMMMVIGVYYLYKYWTYGCTGGL